MAMEIYIGSLAAVAAAGGVIHVLTRRPTSERGQRVLRQDQNKTN